MVVGYNVQVAVLVLVVRVGGVLMSRIDGLHRVPEDLVIFPAEPDVTVCMKPGHVGRKVVNSNSTTTTIRTRFLFPIRDSHRRRDSRRVFKIIIGGVAIAPPDNKTKDGDEEN